MAARPAPSWTLADLAARVAAALGDGGEAPSGRVNPVPDARVIRYYATIGLVDRPTLHGRTALYGRRHLLQLVAVKRLQGEGRSLAEIQFRLSGLTDVALARIARLSPGVDGPELSPPPAAALRREPQQPSAASAEPTASEQAKPAAAQRAVPEPRSARPTTFWSARPAALPPAPPAAGLPTSPAVPQTPSTEALHRTPPTFHPDAAAAGDLPGPPAVSVSQAIRLAPGATLLLDAARPLDREALAAIQRAAGALIEVLTRAGLVPAGKDAP
jgi:DNA-binding transcriptional MerR regulator